MNTKQSLKRWTREEIVILVVEYFNARNFSRNELKPVIKNTSEFLRKRETMITGELQDELFRNEAGISLQMARIRCLDPSNDYSGMQGTKLQKEIVNEYLENPESVIKEADKIYEKYNGR